MSKETPVTTLRDGSIVEDPRLGRLLQPDERSFAYPVRTQIKRNVPRSYTWRGQVVLDQGTEGSCVGHAFAHRLIHRPMERPGIKHVDAVRYYEVAKTIDPWPGEEYEGTSILAGAKAVIKEGLATNFCWAHTLEDLILGVGYHGPAVMGTWWWSTMNTPAVNGAIVPGGRRLGGHAYLLHGVNLKQKIFFGTNSWGRNWGVKGYFTISFADAERLLLDQGEACFLHEVPLRERP